MKLFISADIEGCAGVALTDETHKKESVYQRFAEEDDRKIVCMRSTHEAAMMRSGETVTEMHSTLIR